MRSAISNHPNSTEDLEAPASTPPPVDESPKPLSLRVNFSWMALGSLTFSACKWAILIALTKLIDPALVGQYALGLAITNPVILLANLQLRQVQATDAKRDYPFPLYLGLRLVTSTIAMAVVLLIVVIAGYDLRKSLVIVLVGVTKVVEAMSDVLYGLFQQRERMDRIAKSYMLRGIGATIAMCLAVYLTGELLWGLGAMALAWLLVLGLYDLPTAVRLTGTKGSDDLNGEGTRFKLQLPKLDLRPRLLGRLVWLSLPLGVVALLLTLNQSIPRFFIEGFLSETDLGIFAAVAYLLIPGGMIVGSMGQAVSPKLSQLWAARRFRDFRRLIVRLVGVAGLLGAAGVVAAWLFGPWILTLVYREEYAARADIFLWIMVSAVFFYTATVLGVAITATRQFTRFLVPYAIWTLTALLFSAFLIPPFGLTGAAWTMIGIGFVGVLTPLVILSSARRHT